MVWMMRQSGDSWSSLQKTQCSTYGFTANHTGIWPLRWGTHALLEWSTHSIQIGFVNLWGLVMGLMA